MKGTIYRILFHKAFNYVWALILIVVTFTFSYYERRLHAYFKVSVMAGLIILTAAIVCLKVHKGLIPKNNLGTILLSSEVFMIQLMTWIAVPIIYMISIDLTVAEIMITLGMLTTIVPLFAHKISLSAKEKLIKAKKG